MDRRQQAYNPRTYLVERYVMAHKMKMTIGNIIGLWFGADTPIRQYKIKVNPELWEACQHVSVTFTPPSGAVSVDRYRKSDMVAFAIAVQQELSQYKPVDEEAYEYA